MKKFVDGNKRTGLVATLVFLGLNGRRLEAADDELTDLVLGVAAGRISKADVAVSVRRHRRPRARGGGTRQPGGILTAAAGRSP